MADGVDKTTQKSGEGIEGPPETSIQVIEEIINVHTEGRESPEDMEIQALFDSGVGTSKADITLPSNAAKIFLAEEHGKFGEKLNPLSEQTQPKRVTPKLRESTLGEEILLEIRESMRDLSIKMEALGKVVIEVTKRCEIIDQNFGIHRKETSRAIETMERALVEAVDRRLETVELRIVEKMKIFQTHIATEVCKVTAATKDRVRDLESKVQETAERMSLLEVNTAQHRLTQQDLENKVQDLTAKINQYDRPDTESTRIIMSNQNRQKTIHVHEDEHELEPEVENTTFRTQNRRSTENHIRLIPPTFDASGNQRPMKFLREFKQYCSVMQPHPAELKYLIGQCFKAAAKEWWLLVEEYVHSVEELESKFVQRYWSKEVQRKVRRNLEFGFYTKDEKTNKVEYATRIFGSARDLIPPPSDKEIVSALAQHFTDEIQATIVGRGFETLEEIMGFLEKIEQGGPTNAKRNKETTEKKSDGQKENQPFRVPEGEKSTGNNPQNNQQKTNHGSGGQKHFHNKQKREYPPQNNQPTPQQNQTIQAVVTEVDISKPSTSQSGN